MREGKTKYKIYCDMDGVLTDFDHQFESLSGVDPSTYIEMYGKKRFWNLIDTGGEEFWSEMSWTSGGRELWNFLEPYGPVLLSTPSMNPKSRTGKKKWVELNLDPSPKLILSHKKELHATPLSILIDDMDKNLIKWEQAGGIPIKCIKGKTGEVIKELVKLGINT